MIYDSVENLASYGKLAPECMGKIEEFLKRCCQGIEPGHYELDGKKLYANVQSYNPHEYVDDKFEFHRSYADIQLLLAGEETLYYAPFEATKEGTPYDKAGDFGLNTLAGKGTALELKVGNFVLLLPEEAHEPGVGDPASAVVKVVIKVSKEYLV